jgi:hypothetical protein
MSGGRPTRFHRLLVLLAAAWVAISLAVGSPAAAEPEPDLAFGVARLVTR